MHRGTSLGGMLEFPTQPVTPRPSKSICLPMFHENEQALAMGGVTTGLVGLGEQVTWRAKHFGLWHDLTSKATVLKPPTYFQVTMVKGIFRSMQADHLFRSLPSGATELRDTFAIGSAPNPRTRRNTRS